MKKMNSFTSLCIVPETNNELHKNDIKKRNNVDKWSFSLIPIQALIDKDKGCCCTHISSAILQLLYFSYYSSCLISVFKIKLKITNNNYDKYNYDSKDNCG